MQIENETPILSCILCKMFKTLYSTQFFKLRTLSYCDNVAGHMLVAIGKGRRVPELCHQGANCSCFTAAVAHMLARVFAHVSCLLKCENTHGIPFVVVEKVSLCGNLEKKEVVWHNLRGKRC